MGTTNEFERDLEDQAGLKRPGRVDLRLFQNTPDAGDGHPGLQRCFRNYLHEGGMEKDLELVGYGIKGTSVDINNAELQQLSNIGSVTINGTQWEYVGGADQPVKQGDSPTFNGLTLTSLTVNGNITITGNVDGVDVSDFKSDYNTHKISTGVDHSYIDQSIKQADSPTFVGLTLSANVVTTSTVDGVDISIHDHTSGNKGVAIAHSSTSGRTVNDHHNQSHVLSGGDHTASGLTIGHVIRATGATTFAWAQLGHGDLSAIGSNAHSVIDTHLGSTSNPHGVTLDNAFDASKIIDGVNSEANAFQIGDGSDILKIWASNGIILSSNDHLALRTTADYRDVDINPTGTGAKVIINPGDTGSWDFEGLVMTPYSANTMSIGSDSAELSDIWYCTVHDTTCADFSHYSLEELYSLFEQIKPMTDGGLHYNKHNKQSFPHIDLKTLPLEFADIASKAMTKNNVWEKNEKREVIFRNVDYKKGDTIGVDAGTFLYALKSFVVKIYEKNMVLEQEIEDLRNN